MTVTIIDTGPTRVLEIVGEQRGFYGVVRHHRTETYYSRETLDAMLAVRGEMWLSNEIARAEEPSYIQDPLRRQFERFVPVYGKRVLDFGCGCGGSTLCLARLGAAEVTGVEPDLASVHVARLRARDAGLGDRVTFEHVADTRRLPFGDGCFDAVIMNAVVEHIPSRERRVHLQEIWRVIAADGYLFVNETPNRLWPQEYHTTGLWGVSYMPLGLAVRYAVARGRLPRNVALDAALSMGFRGGTFWEIAGALGRDACLQNWTQGDDVALFWERTLERPGQTSRRLAVKRMLFALHRLVDHGILRPLGVPAVAFLPELSLCFEKNDNAR